MNKSQESASAPPESESLAEVRRGSITESRHRGHIVAVDSDGIILARFGSPDALTYLRSSAKPFQTFPLVATGAADRFGLDEREIAIACGSHNGDPIHVETVSSILGKIGLDASALKCGTHEPYSPEAARALRESGTEPSVLHSNCSGKHAGMLALALHLGAPIETYDQPDNPVQLSIARAVEHFSGVPLEDIAVGIDGCGVPVHGVPLRAMALMYARLVVPPATFDSTTRDASRRIVASMLSHPEMIGGETESLDTALMRVVPGSLIAKAGAEGLFTAGVLPSERWPRGLGLAIKIEDGDKGSRARRPVVVETLGQLGLLSDDALRALSPYAVSPIKNHRSETVGEVRASFQLQLTGFDDQER
ncbi:MAG TPA: asparaginase [Pyrinomonadaceae bacterium]|jgi:L-asparaginase II